MKRPDRIAIFVILTALLVGFCIAASSQQLFTPTPRFLTWNFNSNKYSPGAVFTVYQTPNLAQLTNLPPTAPALTNFPATQNLTSTNGSNYIYSLPVALTYPASIFAVSVSNQSGIAWCVNPLFLPTDPLFQAGDLTGLGLK